MAGCICQTDIGLDFSNFGIT